MSMRQNGRSWPLLVAGLAAVGNLTTTRAADAGWETRPDGIVGQLANFEGVGGVKIAGYVRKPAGPGPFPLVIILHGAGPVAKPVAAGTNEVRAEKMAAEAARAGNVMGRATSPPIPEFLAQGWVVYSVDYRPNPRYAIDPLEFDDTMIAIAKARAFPFVDPQRLAIFGGSHGGHVAGRMISRTNFAGAVLCAPAGLDLIELAHLARKGTPVGGNQRLIREMERRAGVSMAEIETNAGAYQYSSLLTEASKVRCPVLLVSGKDDNNAPLAVMEMYLEKLRGLGKAAETYHPDHGPHGFYVGLPQRIPETAESTRRVVAFIKKHFEAAAK